MSTPPTAGSPHPLLVATTMTRPVTAAALRTLANPFFEGKEGLPRVFAAFCCDKVYVGYQPAVTCSKCHAVPVNIEASSVEQIACLGVA